MTKIPLSSKIQLIPNQTHQISKLANINNRVNSAFQPCNIGHFWFSPL